jgi:type IV secretory pathway TraG/TraD family ATPase VirD4
VPAVHKAGMGAARSTLELLLSYALLWSGLALALRRRGEAWTLYLRALVTALLLLVPALVVLALIERLLPEAASPLLALVMLPAAGFGAGEWLHAPNGLREYLKRGTRIVDSQAPPAAAGQLLFCGEPLALLDETKHFKLIGTTGTGKSTAIGELLAGALARGDRAVIADPNGGYLARHYDPGRGDVILNPFEARSVRWDAYAELEAPYDFEALARALIPDGRGEERVWRLYAQTLLSSVLRQTAGAGVREVSELYRLIASAPPEELAILLDGTPAATFLAGGNERMFGSVRAVANAALAGLAHLAIARGPPFSIRRWVREGSGVLFLPYQALEVPALGALVSAWMRVAIVEALSGQERDARLWFIVDELDALGVIDGLKDALARLRKFGGRCVLAFQSIAQVAALYGHEAPTIVENCGNTLILRSSASEHGGTAAFAARLVGEREIQRETLSESRSGRADGRGSTTRSVTQQRESALLASEIEQLPDLQGFLKVASRPEWLRVTLSQSPGRAS